MATVRPGSTTSDRSSISGLSGLYENETCSKLTWPFGVGTDAVAISGVCSSASSSSNTRSAEAMPDWNMLAIDASWLSGIVNWREYWMNACTPPSVIAPAVTRTPPSTAMATKFRLPITIIDGWMMPDTNCAPNDASYSTSLV